MKKQNCWGRLCLEASESWQILSGLMMAAGPAAVLLVKIKPFHQAHVRWV